MISYNYNFDEFISYLKDKDFGEIIRIAEEETYEAERLIMGGRRGAPKERERGCPEYVNMLKGFLFFMRYAIKPSGVADYDFPRFFPVVKSLVDRKQFRPEILNMFQETKD